MTDTPKPEPLRDEDLDRVEGGGLLLPAVQAAKDRSSVVLQFDEADAVKHAARGKRIVAQSGNGEF